MSRGRKVEGNHEEFIKQIEELVGNEYIVLTTYRGKSRNVKFRHNECGNIYETSPHRFIVKGMRCQKCTISNKNKSNMRTTEEFKKKVFEMVQEEYEVLGEYTGSTNKVLMKHKEDCGHEWLIEANSFLQGKRCPKCFLNLLLSTDDFKEKVFNLVGTEYSVLGEYVNTKTKIKMKHNICEYTYNVQPNDFINSGSRCPKCANNLPYTTKSFKEKIFELVGNEYELLSEYNNSQTKVSLIHNVCGYSWKTTPNTFISGSRCPRCKKSKGEKEILDFLTDNKIFFVEQYVFEDCRYEQFLKFDFAIFDDNLEIECLIEYDGEQHYRPVEIWGGAEGYEKQREKDEIKNKYCEDNNIKLLRIPYWELKNIHNILKENLEAFVQNKSE